jgi:hypothetical protein
MVCVKSGPNVSIRLFLYFVKGLRTDAEKESLFFMICLFMLNAVLVKPFYDDPCNPVGLRELISTLTFKRHPLSSV